MKTKKENSNYEKLMSKYIQFSRYIASEGIIGIVGMLTEYMVKIEIEKGNDSYGFAIIYYKPTKSKYTFVTNEINNYSMMKYLTKLWENMCEESI